MSTPIIRPGPVAVSNRLWDRDKLAWLACLAQATAEGITLLDLIDRRLRAVRDECAREAWDRRMTVAEVAHERLCELRYVRYTA
jgi:ATP-dependent protease HslVU (ClpYQ) peptidase subunit